MQIAYHTVPKSLTFLRSARSFSSSFNDPRKPSIRIDSGFAVTDIWTL